MAVQAIPEFENEVGYMQSIQQLESRSVYGFYPPR